MKQIALFILLFIIVQVRGQSAFDLLQKEYERYLKEEKHDSALTIAQKMNAWALKNETDSSLRYAVSLRYIGNCFNSLNQNDSAIIYQLQSKDVYSLSKGIYLKDIAILNTEIADCYISLQDYDFALRFYLEGLDYFKNIDDDNERKKSIYYKIGVAYMYLNDIKNAIYYQKENIKLIENENPNSMDHAIGLANLALGFSLINDYISVDSLYNRAIKIALNQKSLDTSFILTNNRLKLDFLINVQKLEMAERQLDNFSEWYEKYDPYEYVQYLNTKGLFYNTKSMNDISSAFLEKAIKICVENKQEDSDLAKVIMGNLGVSYLQSGQFEKAKYYFLKSIDGTELSNEISGTLYNLGIVNYALNDFESAKKYLLNANIYTESTIEQLNINVQLSVLYFELNDLDSTKYFLSKADSLKSLVKFSSADLFVPFFYQSASIYYQIGEIDKANQMINKAIEQVMNSNYQRPITSGILKLKSLLELDNKDNSIYHSYIFKLKEYELYNIRQNFNWLSSDEKKTFISNFDDSRMFILKYTIRSKKNYTKECYDIVSFFKSLLLETNRELDQAISKSSDEEMIDKFSYMKQLRRLYSKMHSEGSSNIEMMHQFKNQADSLDKILVNKLGEYAASKRKFEISWNDIQLYLSSEDAAIEFARYFDNTDSAYKYLAFVLRSDYEYPKLVKLGREEVISSAVQSKNFTLLYKEVWQEIDSLLLGVNRIFYSPDGVLNNVSFSALCLQSEDKLITYNKQINRGIEINDNSKSNSECTSYLMDKYELHQLTTTRYLADGSLLNRKYIQPSLSIVGGVNFNEIPLQENIAEKKQSSEDLALNINLNKQLINTKKKTKRSSSGSGKKMPYLPGTMEEVVNISHIFKDNHWQVHSFSDNRVGEYDLKKFLDGKSPGVLHIATHGFAFPDNVKKEPNLMKINQTSTYKMSEDPMVRCGLMLSGSNISWTGNAQKMIEETGEDGILTAAEVANMDLSNTKLVVLSACETGLGKIEGSEGTFGLKRGFKLAGVEQLIVSLWSVPDKETMELMTLFYSDLTKTLNPVISFEKAQKEMRNKYPTEPEKWAGFVLVR